MDISSLRERPNVSTFSVSELNGYIKSIFDNDRALRSVSVRGEISNFTRHGSGHLYFSLKDPEGQIRAVMFRSSAVRLAFFPENGMKVILHGSVSVYPRDGSYQLYVNSMQPDGIGALYLAYEQLKAKLASEGLFDEYHKRPLPRIPRRVGVITSPTGAAVRDIINVTGRRFPFADIYIYPALVQGMGAEADLIEAVDYFDKSKLCDVVIIGRGGGSIEDLWAFNSEKLARRIFEAEVPIISAVGHETDFTICDFVSDMRAPTPSAAAELAVPDTNNLILRIDGMLDRAASALKRTVEIKSERLSKIVDNPIMKSPLTMLDAAKSRIDELLRSAVDSVRDSLESRRAIFSVLAGKLDALSPLAVLSRGYSVAFKDGEVIKSVGALKKNDGVSIRFKDGVASAVVSEVNYEK